MVGDRYPNWRQRWDAKTDEIGAEIEGWWNRTRAGMREGDTTGEKMQAAGHEAQRTADRVGDTLAGRNDAETQLERAGDHVSGWWAGMKNKFHDTFLRDDDTPEVREEINRAWNDDDFVAERFEERRVELQRNGRLKD